MVAPTRPWCIGVECWGHRQATTAAVYSTRAVPYCDGCLGLHKAARLADAAEAVTYADLTDNAELAAALVEAQGLGQ